METIDLARTRITHPGGIASPARFVFVLNGDNTGTAAVWVEQRRPTRSASRVLLATGTFTQAASARTPHTFTTDSGEEWAITPLAGGGCGCNKRNSPLANVTIDQLVSPDFSSA